MKVINEKDYVFVEFKDGWFIFKSNPDKVDFDPEILMVKRARFIRKDGSFTFYQSRLTTSS